MGALDTTKGVIQIIGKYWAYNCATFLCFVIWVLTFTAFFVPWFRDHYDGEFHWVINNTIVEQNTTWSITEYYFKLEINLFDADVTCNYADGVCNLGSLAPYLPGLKGWDLQYYDDSYSASFAFGIIVLLIAMVLGPLIQILQWRPKLFPRRLRIVMFFVTLGVAISLFIAILIDWSIHLGHPRFVQQSLGVSTTYCDSYSISRHWYAGQLCSWLGHRTVGSSAKQLPFIDVEVRNFYQYWNPRDGWQMMTVNLGLALLNIIVVVGWHPTFEE